MAEDTTLLEYAPHAEVHSDAAPTFFEDLGYPAHHFEDEHQQHDATTLGMWLFLGTEVLLFGGMFCAEFIYRYLYPGEFVRGSNELNVMLGTINTGVLLTSSLLMALAVRAAQMFDRKMTDHLPAATIVFGLAFLGIKAVEWHADWMERPDPLAARASRTRPSAPATPQFWVLYFMMTGTHALHMVFGAGVLGDHAVMAWRGSFRKNPNPVEMAGLYWHFVDIVWVFLFPTLYLVQGYHESGGRREDRGSLGPVGEATARNGRKNGSEADGHCDGDRRSQNAGRPRAPPP